MARRKSNGSDYSGQLADLREKIAATRAERRRVEQAPCSIEEAEARIREWVEALASRYIHRSAFTSAVVYDRPKLVGDDPEAFEAYHHADRIIEKRLELARADLEQRGPGISAEDRAGRLDALDAEHFALQREREDLRREAEQRGVEDEREPDTPPEVLIDWNPATREYDRERLRALEAKLRARRAEVDAIIVDREQARSAVRSAQLQIEKVAEVPTRPPPTAQRWEPERWRSEAQQELEAAQAEVKRLAAEYAEAAQRSKVVGALVQSCRDFLRERGVAKREGATLTHTRASAGMPT